MKSEVTINYVITDEKKKVKMVCVDEHSIPIVAIIDTELMATMPKFIAATTGMDALTHYCGNNRNGCLNTCNRRIYLQKQKYYVTNVFD